VPYYVILVFVILLSIFSGVLTGFWLSLASFVSYTPEKNGLTGVVLAAITNLTVFFQDWIFFIKQDPGAALSFSAQLQKTPAALYNYLLIQPAWSIGIEIMYYLFVPLLARLRTHWLVLIALLSLAARIYTYQVLGLVGDPFGFRFFPFELLLFVGGMLIYRGYERTLMKKETWSVKTWWQYILFIVVMITISYFLQRAAILLRHPVGRPYAPLVSYIFWIPVIPVAFHLTRHWKLDRFLGEITYTIYLSHFVIIQFMDIVFVSFSIPGKYLGIASALVAVGFSILLYIKLFEPFERKREGLSRALVARWRGQSKVTEPV
jgi:peptidoglycan/LPS O-acetylase OafA/YrhL